MAHDRETIVLRWLFIALGTITGLLALAIAAVIILFDPNDYRDELAAALERETGRAVSLRGAIDWSLWPGLRIELGALSLGSGAGFADTPLVRIEGLSAGLALAPLWRGRVELDTLVLREPVIHLIRNSEGRANWQPGDDAAATRPAEPGGRIETGRIGTGTNIADIGAGWLAGLSLGGIDLVNGRIRYEDRASGETLTAEAIDLELGSIAIGETTPLAVQATIQRGEQRWQSRLRSNLIIRQGGAVAVRDGRIELGDLEASGIAADIVPGASGWRVHPFTARFYDGDYSGDLRFGTDSAGLPLRFDERLDGVAIGELLDALTGFARVRGEAGVTADGEIALAGSEPVLASLDAETRIDIRHGAVRGIDIEAILSHALARLEGRPPPADRDPPSTAFRTLSASITVRDGVARTNDILLDSPLLRVRGGGESDLLERTLAATLRVTLIGRPEGAAGKALESLQGVEIPLRIEGRWNDPRISVDIAEVIRESRGTRIRDRIEEEVDALRERLEGLLD